jgi:hypothetical protein
MRKHHLFAFYCTLLVPVGALAGLAVGRVTAGPVIPVIVGAVLGLASSCLLLHWTRPDERP